MRHQSFAPSFTVSFIRAGAGSNCVVVAVAGGEATRAGAGSPALAAPAETPGTTTRLLLLPLDGEVSAEDLALLFPPKRILAASALAGNRRAVDRQAIASARFIAGFPIDDQT
ncbi:MAG: hypothetical protein B7Z10_03245 [Rhodobacterales bacterium 32-66-7]|nr:MAG: hypothetical protein B7Z10_03245 [Rhodobacterales bacterium 32-66-7]